MVKYFYYFVDKVQASKEFQVICLKEDNDCKS